MYNRIIACALWILVLLPTMHGQTVQVFVELSAASEVGPAAGIFRFTRTGSLSSSLTANFTLGGTATSGSDYLIWETSAVFEPGNATAYVTVLPRNDNIVEATPETIVLTLTPSPNYSIGAANQATISIQDAPAVAPGVFGFADPILVYDLRYLETAISGGVLYVQTILNNINFATVEIFLDTDQNPATGDYRPAGIAGAEYRATIVVTANGFFGDYTLRRLPRNPQDCQNIPPQEHCETTVINLGQVMISGTSLVIGIPLDKLGNPSAVDVMATVHHGSNTSFLQGQGDRIPSCGWLDSSNNRVVLRRHARTTVLTVDDATGDGLNGAIGYDIQNATFWVVADQVYFRIRFTQPWNPTNPQFFPGPRGEITIDSDRSLRTGSFFMGDRIATWGGDAQLLFDFSSPVGASIRSQLDTTGAAVPFNDKFNDGRWLYVGNELFLTMSISVLDAFQLTVAGQVRTQTRVPTDGRVRSSLSVWEIGPSPPQARIYDQLPDQKKAVDWASGDVLTPFAWNPQQTATFFDPMEYPTPVSGQDLIRIDAQVFPGHLVLKGVLSAFLPTDYGNLFKILLDTDNNPATGVQISNPFNGGPTIGADYTVVVGVADLQAPVYIVNVRSPGGNVSIHDAWVNVEPNPNANMNGSFTVTIPLDVLAGSGNTIPFYLTTGTVVVEPYDIAPPQPIVLVDGSVSNGPDLTINKSHGGNFVQGQSGATYTITVSNSGGAPTSGTVTVVDTLPTGLTATAMAGTGWSCTVATRTCTRNDVLAAAASYPSITLTVNVSSNASSSVTNTVTVSGGGDTNSGNNSASDPTTIIPVADLTISKTHTGNFTQGQTGATYTITVTNSGAGATSGTVTVVDTLPTGLTATAMAGTGWSCTVATRTCTRNDVLAAAASYPSITLTVNVASNAPSTVTNMVTVSGGGDANSGNNSASDPTTIIPVADLTISKTHTGSFTQGQIGATYTITVTNSGPGATSGTVTVTDTLPIGLTPTAMAGSGWSCTVATRICTRSDVLAAAASYPAITLTVNVAANAPSLVTNTVTVAGGGEVNTSNNTASDPTAIGTLQLPDLTIVKSHAGNFVQGQIGATYTITVTNSGVGPTNGAISVTDTLPVGLTATSLAGPGWSCTLGNLTCTRSDSLAAATSYPPITLTVNVAGNAPGSVTNTASVSGGGETNTSNNTANDPTTIVSPTPAVNSLSPVTSTGLNQTYTIVFTDPAAFASGVVNLLVNNFIDGRQACYIAFVPSSSQVILVNDAGDAGGNYAGVLTLPTSGVISNGQCSISGAGSSATLNGSTLTLVLALTFKQAFGGDKILYGAANTGQSTGWQPMGVVRIPPVSPAAPTVLSVSPASGSSSTQTFTVTYQNDTAGSDIAGAQLLINNALDGRQACYVAYSKAGGALFLVDDAGNGGGPFAGGIVVANGGTMSNSQCTVQAAANSVTTNGQNLTMVVNVTFAGGFPGRRILYGAAQSNAGNSGWQAVGAWSNGGSSSSGAMPSN